MGWYECESICVCAHHCFVSRWIRYSFLLSFLIRKWLFGSSSIPNSYYITDLVAEMLWNNPFHYIKPNLFEKKKPIFSYYALQTASYHNATDVPIIAYSTRPSELIIHYMMYICVIKQKRHRNWPALCRAQSWDTAVRRLFNKYVIQNGINCNYICIVVCHAALEYPIIQYWIDSGVFRLGLGKIG